MTLANAPIGLVPIIFANDDLPELTPPIDPEALADEVARLGFAGCQLSRALPSLTALKRRDLRIAEVYAAIPCALDGPPADARTLALERLEALQRASGDVLVFSYHLSKERVGWSGRATHPDTPRLSEEGRARALELINEVARHCASAGRRLAYHPHSGTFVETPDEVEWLMQSTDPDLVGLCLDVGHYIVGCGDPVDAIRRYGPRVRHVHMKDVDAGVLQQLRDGSISGFLAALRARIFTELGNGVLDMIGVLGELARLNYAGWLMCEQDTTWRPAAESAAISRAVLGYSMRLAMASRASAVG